LSYHLIKVQMLITLWILKPTIVVVNYLEMIEKYKYQCSSDGTKALKYRDSEMGDIDIDISKGRELDVDSGVDPQGH